MATSPSLFSRAHPKQKAPPKKVRGFMSLPGEVRNIVYSYYFAPAFRCEFAARGRRLDEPQSRTVKLWPAVLRSNNSKPFQYITNQKPERPVTVRISRTLGKYSQVKGLQTNWLSSLYALTLVCKQVYTETTPFLYDKTVFVFDAPKRIAAFLTVLPQKKLSLITKLQLHYDTYGHPVNSRDCIWQDKHHESWVRICRAASKKLFGLKSLELWVHVHDCAPKFNLRQKWLVPLLQFRRLKCTPKSTMDTGYSLQQHQPGLVDVKVHVRTRWSKSPLNTFNGNQPLARASKELHSLFSCAIGLAILGSKEKVAMARFEEAWEGEYAMWKHHLQFASTGW